MEIRKYQDSDCVEIADLFHDSAHAISTSVYSKEELEARSLVPHFVGNTTIIKRVNELNKVLDYAKQKK